MSKKIEKIAIDAKGMIKEILKKEIDKLDIEYKQIYEKLNDINLRKRIYLSELNNRIN